MHTETSDRGMSHNFIGPGAAAIGLRGLKTRWWSVCSFSISSEYTKALSVPQIKKPEELSQANVRAAPEILFANMYFSFFCVRNSLFIFVQVFYVHPVYSSLISGNAFHTHKKQ